MEQADRRREMNLTRQEAADHLHVSLRSYKSYENDPEKAGTLKYNYMAEKLEEAGRVDETHGLLTVDEIRRVCEDKLRAYPVSYAYLFGSYAKGKATETSDVDLLVSGEVSGLRFYGMVEDLREALRKQVDVLTSNQLLKNPELLDEILRDGVRVYGQPEE